MNQLVSDSINTVIIGHNKDWKQDINIGRQNNQSFVSVPHSMFIKMLKYKCQLKGINVVCVEESYTSKASLLDNDPVPTPKDKGVVFSGSRVSRGLYRDSKGQLLNADVNGSFNIIRKEICDVVLQPTDRGLVFNPFKVSF